MCISRSMTHCEDEDEDSPPKLYSDQGFWKVAYDVDERLRAGTPSHSPTTGNIIQALEVRSLRGQRLAVGLQ